MLGAVGGELQATPRQLELVPKMTQLGYGLGIALLAPPGDRFDRKKIFLAYLQRVAERPAYRSAMSKGNRGLAPMLH